MYNLNKFMKEFYIETNLNYANLAELVHLRYEVHQVNP